MPRQPHFQLPLNDNVLVGLVVGDNQVVQPITYGVFKAAIIGQSMKVGTFVYSTPDPEQPKTQTITFGGTPLSNANAVAAFILPNNVNYDPSTVVITTTGMTVDMIGDGDGNTVGYIVAVENS